MVPRVLASPLLSLLTRSNQLKKKDPSFNIMNCALRIDVIFSWHLTLDYNIMQELNVITCLPITQRDKIVHHIEIGFRSIMVIDQAAGRVRSAVKKE